MIEISYSEIESFFTCQTQWWFRYQAAWKPKSQGRARSLGSLIHEGLHAWWDGRPMHGIVDAWVAERHALLDAEGPLFNFGPEAIDGIATTADWLLERYRLLYGDVVPADVETVESEVLHKAPLSITLNGQAMTVLIKFKPDRIIRWQEQTLLYDYKTMGNFGNDELIEWNPQLLLYAWGLDRLKIPVDAVLLDCIRTYRWTRDEHPPVDSFRRPILYYTDEQLRAYEHDLVAVVTQMVRLMDPDERRARHIGMHCAWCDFAAPCFSERLGYGDDAKNILEESYIQRR